MNVHSSGHKRAQKSRNGHANFYLKFGNVSIDFFSLGNKLIPISWVMPLLFHSPTQLAAFKADIETQLSQNK